MPLGRIALLRDIPHRSPLDCFSALVVIVVNAVVVMFETNGNPGAVDISALVE